MTNITTTSTNIVSKFYMYFYFCFRYTNLNNQNIFAIFALYFINKNLILAYKTPPFFLLLYLAFRSFLQGPFLFILLFFILFRFSLSFPFFCIFYCTFPMAALAFLFSWAEIFNRWEIGVGGS